MQPLNIRAGLVLPSLSLVTSLANGATAERKDCNGHVCKPVEEYCSAFAESCAQCSDLCNTESHNYRESDCLKECPDYMIFDPLKSEIHNIRTKQNLILIVLVVLFILIAIRYACKCFNWLRHKRCVTRVLHKLTKRKHPATMNNSNLGATTITNTMAINDIERAPSQIYSVTGAEGSVMTVTTPVSTRYPAESTTPTTASTNNNQEYSYDNAALAITPVTEKPSNAHGF